jgi:hypothetical protein
MKKFFGFILFVQSIFVFSQPCSTFVIVEIGFEPASCRLYPYQSGNGAVYCAVAGGTPDYDYTWTNLETGANVNGAILGGLNTGHYKVVVTDDAGCILTDTVFVDSLSPIASFDVISAHLDLNLESNMWAQVDFVNQSQHYANPLDPNADTTFFWNLNTPYAAWEISHDINEMKDTLYAANGSYNVCLVALNKNGCSDTTCQTITIHSYAGQIGSADSQEIFNVYPTVSDGIFTFSNYQRSEDYTLYVYNIHGNLVLTERLTTDHTKIILDVANGAYLYHLFGSSNTILQSAQIFVIK